MLSQTLDINKDNLTNTSDKISTCAMEQDMSCSRASSSCSCPQCSSIDCFKIRYENANLLCTCPNCKETFSLKNMPIKKCGDDNNFEITIKIDEDEQKNPLQVTVNSDVKNTKSNQECYHETTEDDVLKDEQKDLLNTNNKSDVTVTKNSNDQCNVDLSKNVVKEDDKNKHTVNFKNNVANTKFDDQNHNETSIKPVKEDDQKHLLHSNSKTNTNKKCNNKSCCEVNDKNNEQNNKEYAHIKRDSDEKSCDKTKTLKGHQNKDTVKAYTKTYLPHKKRNEISYRETIRKIINEHEENDALKDIEIDKSEVNLREHTALSYKNTLFFREKLKKTEKSYEEMYTRNYSVAMTYAGNKENTESENPACTLSAQVMNIPTHEFKDSFSSHKTPCSMTTNKVITKQPDILAKLRDIYKACSCKVCECIPGFSGNNVFTDSRNENTIKTHEYHTESENRKTQRDRKRMVEPHSGCPCYRCDRKDCRGVLKHKVVKPSCDCKPCECVQYSITKPCDCEPCQCAECTSLNFHVPCSVIVAPVQGNFQQNLCQCEPCECTNCTHSYGAMASSLMREVSTGMVTHRNCNCESCANNICQFDGVDCRCDTQNRIVRKPIDRNVRDYDLRRALIGESSLRRKSDKFKNFDTIAMFTFSNDYNTNTVFNTFGEMCHCMDCECTICRNKEMFGNKIKNSYEDIPLVFANVSDKSFSECKCRPCECEACFKDKTVSDTVTIAVNNCDHCITYKPLPHSSQNIEIKHSKLELKNKTFDISSENCIDLGNNISRDFFYPVRKGKLLTPSMFEAKMLSYAQFQSQTDITKKPLENNLLKRSNKEQLRSQNLSISDTKSANRYFGVDYNQLSYSSLLSTFYLNDSCINNVPKIFDNTFIGNNTIRNIKNAHNTTNNIKLPTTDIILANSSLSTCEVNSMKKVKNYNHNASKCYKTNSLHSNKHLIVNRLSKAKMNIGVDLFCNRIKSFEKSISQLQQDISRNLMTLAEIRSKNGVALENISGNAGLIYSDIINEKSIFDIHDTSINGSAKITKLYKEPDKLQKTETKKIEKNVNHQEYVLGCTVKSGVDIKYDRNDNFGKGDNKTYMKTLKKPHVNVNKLRKNVTKSKVRKLSIHSENKISDFLTAHIKENCRRGKNELLNIQPARFMKSASTSYENCSVAEHEEFKLNNDTEHLPTGTHQDMWSVTKKNLFVNNMEVAYSSSAKPQLEIDIKRTVESLQTNFDENRGHAALLKIQGEISQLLNSPLLELESNKKYLRDINIVDSKNFKPKNKLDSSFKNVRSEAGSQTRKQTMLVEKEIECNIGQSTEEINTDMKKLMDFILTRTVCKSELSKPLKNMPEIPKAPKISSVKSSCERLKASFLGLRRVSDHTVLVKWRMPQKVEDVQGYELQVDGRAVQKILSPTKCMAVLTCLPHCDKLLLTIRTLTFSDLPSDHHPAATIVYCPKEKRPRYPQPCFTGEA